MPPWQTLPQVPQLASSLLVSTQEPLQFVPEAQLVAQLLPEQTCVWEHIVPQAPQLAGLLAVDTHTPLHSASSVAQMQDEATQVVPPVHAFPHRPQLFESVPSETQAPLQLVNPGPQVPPSLAGASPAAESRCTMVPSLLTSVVDASRTLPVPP